MHVPSPTSRLNLEFTSPCRFILVDLESFPETTSKVRVASAFRSLRSACFTAKAISSSNWMRVVTRVKSILILGSIIYPCSPPWMKKGNRSWSRWRHGAGIWSPKFGKWTSAAFVSTCWTAMSKATVLKIVSLLVGFTAVIHARASDRNLFWELAVSEPYELSELLQAPTI